MNLTSAYKHQIPIQIRFSDVDRLNHVNNACYLNFFELGRVRYFNDVFNPDGNRNLIDWNTRGFVLARTEINHINPIFLNDEVYCYTKVIKLGNKSLTIQNLIVKKQNNELIECANGLGILVASDYENNVSIEIPDDWRKAVITFEGDLK